jgi:hypothetical protein
VLVHPESPKQRGGAGRRGGQHLAAAEGRGRRAAQTYIVATDNGILHRMRQLAPGKTLIEAPTAGASATCKSCAHCPWMAMNALQGVVDCLEHGQGEITCPSPCAAGPLGCIERMLDFVKAHPGALALPARQRTGPGAEHRRGLKFGGPAGGRARVPAGAAGLGCRPQVQARSADMGRNPLAARHPAAGGAGDPHERRGRLHFRPQPQRTRRLRRGAAPRAAVPRPEQRSRVAGRRGLRGAEPLAPRYIRHEVDYVFYLSERERGDSERQFAEAVEYAFGFVQARTAMRARG